MAGSQAFNVRTLREGPLWEECKHRVQPDAKRLDEQLVGITWKIAHDAESCWSLRGNLYVTKTDPWPDAPALRIYFTIDDDAYCTLLWFELAPEDD